MNRLQRNSNRQNAELLRHLAICKHVLGHICENCGEPGGHWFPDPHSIESIMRGEEETGFYSCHKEPPHQELDTGIMNPSEFVVGGCYYRQRQPERLIYLGDNFSCDGFWHQFAKVGTPNIVWCEVKGSELNHFVRAKEPS